MYGKAVKAVESIVTSMQSLFLDERRMSLVCVMLKDVIFIFADLESDLFSTLT